MIPMEENKVLEIEKKTPSEKDEKLEKYFTFTEVVFSIFFAILVTLFLYNAFGFQLAKRFSIVIRWSTAVVVWGWVMVLTLYGVDQLNRRFRKKFNLILQCALTLYLAGGLNYFLVLLFRRY